MSTTAPTTDKKVYKALPIISDAEFTVGISKKSGNEYIVGAVYIKSTVSDTPIRLSFDYIDPNIRELIKMSLDKFASDQSDDFSGDIKG